jgi:hypothetical protein
MVSSPEAEVSIASPAPSTPVRPSVEHSPPNTYEDPDCQETDYSIRAVFCFFSAFQGLALSTVGLIR